MDKNMTLEKRIDAELYSYQGRMSVFVDDLQGHTVERGADEEFETASVIKAFLLAALYLQAERGKADRSKIRQRNRRPQSLRSSRRKNAARSCAPCGHSSNACSSCVGTASAAGPSITSIIFLRNCCRTASFSS